MAGGTYWSESIGSKDKTWGRALGKGIGKGHWGRALGKGTHKPSCLTSTVHRTHHGHQIVVFLMYSMCSPTLYNIMQCCQKQFFSRKFYNYHCKMCICFSLTLSPPSLLLFLLLLSLSLLPLTRFLSSPSPSLSYCSFSCSLSLPLTRFLPPPLSLAVSLAFLPSHSHSPSFSLSLKLGFWKVCSSRKKSSHYSMQTSIRTLYTIPCT